MLVELDDEHTKCGICVTKFSSDRDNKDPEIRKHLPVLSSSQRCDHWFCHGCILREQLRVAEENNGKIPKWIKCMHCREKTSFNPAEPKYHRLLIDLLARAQKYAAAQVKAEQTEVEENETTDVTPVKEEQSDAFCEDHAAPEGKDGEGDDADDDDVAASVKRESDITDHVEQEVKRPRLMTPSPPLVRVKEEPIEFDDYDIIPSIRRDPAKESDSEMSSISNTSIEERMPKRKRMKTELGESGGDLAAALSSSSSSATTTLVPSTKPDTGEEATAAAVKQIESLQNKHAHSNATSWGEANLFFDIAGKMHHVKVTKRCISAKDCVPGRTYMDNTSFSQVLRKHNCPLVAFCLNGQKWYRGYLLYLGVRETVILGLKEDGSFLSSVHIFKPMETDKDLRIAYINLVNESMDSRQDGFLNNKTNGPDVISIDSLPDWAMGYRSRGVEPILQMIPPNTINVRVDDIPRPLKASKNKKTRWKNGDCSFVNSKCSLPPTSDCSVTEEDWKSHLAFISPDEGSKVYFVPLLEAKEIINCGQMSRPRFLELLKKKSRYNIDCNTMDIPDNGLTLTKGKSTGESHGIIQHFTPWKHPYQLSEDIIAQYSTQQPIEVQDHEALSFLIRHVTNGYSRDHGYVGIKLTKGINSSDRTRDDARNDCETKKQSELWTDRMNSTYAPHLYHIIAMLARFTAKMAKRFDPVVSQAYRDVYKDIIVSDRGKSAMKLNLEPDMGISSLQALAYPDESGINFADEGRVDLNDANAVAFNKAMEQKLVKSLTCWSEKLDEDEGHDPIFHRKLYLQEISSIFHLLTLGTQGTSGDESDEKPLKYSTKATCAHQIMYKGDSSRNVLATFCFPKNRTVVKFEANKLTFQHWSRYDTFHQTPVAITFDDSNVYLKDEDLVILAWVVGTPKTADLPTDQNTDDQDSERCKLLRSQQMKEKANMAFNKAMEEMEKHTRKITLSDTAADSTNDQPQSLMCSTCKVSTAQMEGDATICKECNLNDHHTFRQMKEALHTAMDELKKLKHSFLMHEHSKKSRAAEGLEGNIENSGDGTTQLMRGVGNEALLCSTCKLEKKGECYSKKQRKLGEAASCRECVTNLQREAMVALKKSLEELRLCSTCKVAKTLECYSKRQRKLGEAASCKDCVTNLQREAKATLKSSTEEPKSRQCPTCNVEKTLESFPEKHLKQEQVYCRLQGVYPDSSAEAEAPGDKWGKTGLE